MIHYGKLDSNGIISEIVQSKSRINDGEHVFLSAEDGFDGSSYIGRKWSRPSVPWKTISRRQAKQQIIIDGLDDQVQATIDAIADTTERKLAQAWLDNADPWERDNATLLSIAGEMGLTSDQIDTMFKEASKR